MFKVTFVCTGNRCRSPYAEACLRNLAPNWVDVSSAGTLDLPGAEPPYELSEVARDRGIDLSLHSSRPITQAELPEADLVLGMALDHVAEAVVTGGADSESAFSISEFVRFLDRDDADSTAHDPDAARDLVESIHRRRIAERVFVPVNDVVDPIGGPRSAYEKMADRIDHLCRLISIRVGWVDPTLN